MTCRIEHSPDENGSILAWQSHIACHHNIEHVKEQQSSNAFQAHNSHPELDFYIVNHPTALRLKTPTHSTMDAGPSKRTTVYVAGFAQSVNEQQLLDAFVTFGDIIEISLPSEHDGGEQAPLPPSMDFP